MPPCLLPLILSAAALCGGAASDDSSQRCTCLPCGTPCTYPSPPPQSVYYTSPPPPPMPEYYPPPPPPPSPPPPVLPLTPSKPNCPPPPPPPSPSNPCCTPSAGGTPYFGLTPPGQLYPQDPTFRPSAARRSREGRSVLFGAFALVGLWGISFSLHLL